MQLINLKCLTKITLNSHLNSFSRLKIIVKWQNLEAFIHLVKRNSTNIYEESKTQRENCNSHWTQFKSLCGHLL